MDMPEPIIVRQDALPADPDWLARQPRVVIAYGAASRAASDCAAADVWVPDLDSARKLERRIATWPLAAITLVQVLRATERLPPASGLDVESLAYSTLQAGPEFKAWRSAYSGGPLTERDSGDAVVLARDGDVITAVLNRPSSRNAITVEMRDALVEMLQLLAADRSVRELRISANGACFSVGGELREFGQAPDPATAHGVRTVHSPARLLADLGDRVTCYLHGACIGSGMELPAFAGRVAAHSKTFFQLPELQLGLIPGAGGTVSIVRRIGRQRTAWLVLSGRRITAQTALAWGLVDEVVD